MANPYGRENLSRPGFPEIVREALEEEKENEGEGIWREIVRRDEDLQEKLKEKEKEFLEKNKKTQSLEEAMFSSGEDAVDELEKTIDDLI